MSLYSYSRLKDLPASGTELMVLLACRTKVFILYKVIVIYTVHCLDSPSVKSIPDFSVWKNLEYLKTDKNVMKWVYYLYVR